ncbi:putative anion transporter 7 [Triticum urartu]|uniref:Putative anion transporter 7 n=1 Tax=Triticum urartu TaxID=4572 RepID=M7ZQJ1_TRIUA|nr:putative anion transporter 7 [Triticum urartu]
MGGGLCDDDVGRGLRSTTAARFLTRIRAGTGGERVLQSSMDGAWRCFELGRLARVHGGGLAMLTAASASHTWIDDVPGCSFGVWGLGIWGLEYQISARSGPALVVGVCISRIVDSVGLIFFLTLHNDLSTTRDGRKNDRFMVNPVMARMKIPKRYVIVLLTFICTNVCYVERVGFSIAYTVAADAINVNQANKGLILSMFYYGYVLSQIPGGWAAQRLGGRRVLLLSFLLWSLICGLIPLDPNRAVILVLSRLFVGVAQGFIFPAIHTVLAQWVPPQERSRSVSLTTSGMYLGAACGMLFFPSLVKHMGPQSVCLVEAVLGVAWSVIWLKFSSEPPRTDLPKVAMPKVASREKIKAQSVGVVAPRTVKIPWRRIIFSLPVWAIVVNNFTFHYALYVIMNWLPTYFELALKLSLQDMGSSKMLPYFNMFIFSNIGGVVADHLITKRILSVTKTRKLLNTIGFVVSAVALMALPSFGTPSGTVICSSVSLGFLALGRAGFAVNHMDVAPKFAGIVMGVSNTAGTLAGIVGVGLTGNILEAAKASNMDLTNSETWKTVFFVPAYLCIFSSVIFLVFSTAGWLAYLQPVLRCVIFWAYIISVFKKSRIGEVQEAYNIMVKLRLNHMQRGTLVSRTCARAVAASRGKVCRVTAKVLRGSFGAIQEQSIRVKETRPRQEELAGKATQGISRNLPRRITRPGKAR